MGGAAVIISKISEMVDMEWLNELVDSTGMTHIRKCCISLYSWYKQQKVSEFKAALVAEWLEHSSVKLMVVCSNPISDLVLISKY